MSCVPTRPQPSPSNPCLSAVYLPAKLEEGFPLPLPRDTYLNSLELHVHKVSETWGLDGEPQGLLGGLLSGLVDIRGSP